MAIKTFSESKAFSAQAQSEKFQNAIRKSSVSAMDAKNRLRVYSKVMENNERVRTRLRAFSGFAEMPLLTNTYFNATISANIRSFAGFLAMEKDMDQAEVLIGYYDLVGVTDNRLVQPNLGYGSVAGLGAPMRLEVAAAGGAATAAFNEKLIPGSIKIMAGTRTIVDNANAEFLAAPGVVNAAGTNSIDYATGTIKIALTDTAITNIVVIAAKDVAGDPNFGQAPVSNINRFKMVRKYYFAHAVPSLLVAETDLMTIAGADKALDEDIVAIAGKKLMTVYQRVINKSLADCIVVNDISTPYVIDMAAAAAKFLDFQSRIDFFESELVNVNTKLAEQSAEGIFATAYLVGNGVAEWFQKCKQSFKLNKDAKFIDDLVGYYNDVPVLRQSTLPANTGYAVCKLEDGTLAPVIRGIFLPLTQTPVTGSYQGPVQQAQGVYYQEAVGPIAMELCVKFTVTSVKASQGATPVELITES
jgi:hypothetical protein